MVVNYTYDHLTFINHFLTINKKVTTMTILTPQQLQFTRTYLQDVKGYDDMWLDDMTPEDYKNQYDEFCTQINEYSGG